MSFQAKIVTGGKMVLPAALRRELGIRDGDTVVVERDGDSLRVTTRDAALRELQALVRPLVPRDVSGVDDFIAGRRAEAERE